MAVDAGELRRALESVCDIFKMPSLYSKREKKCLEALFKCKSSNRMREITNQIIFHTFLKKSRGL